MKNEKATPADRLAGLYVDAANASKTAASIAAIKNPKIRDILADLIEARVSDAACASAICALIDVDAAAAKALVVALPMSNASGLRQKLAKGFDLPESGKAVASQGFGF